MLVRYHLRTLFGPAHLWTLLGLAAAALWLPAFSGAAPAELRWFLRRAEWLCPPVLMAMTGTLLQVEGQVDERWGATPHGLGRVFLQRWLLAAGYFALALGLFLGLAGLLLPALPVWRTYLSTLVTAAAFSLFGPLVHHLTGSARTGWVSGFGLYFAMLAVAGFWCPADSTYQLWLPFAGLSDAPVIPLLVSKAGYLLLGLMLAAAHLEALAVPERLLERSD